MTDLKKLEFEGIDTCNEISLCEYGMLLAKKDDTYYVIYGCDIGEQGEYINFSWNYFNEEEVEDLIEGLTDDEILSFVGSTYDQWNELPVLQRLYNLYNYFGSYIVFSHNDYEGASSVKDLHKMFNLGF